MDIHMQKILILDFGSQYSQLIARRVRESSVFSQVLPYNTPLTEIKSLKPKGIILSGGPCSIYDHGAPHCGQEIFNLGIPILGICYGMQLMSQCLGGEVARSSKREYGPAELVISDHTDLFEVGRPRIRAWMSHGDQVLSLPDGFISIASTDSCVTGAMKHQSKPLYGVQFHPEVAHTPTGTQIIQNFLFRICGCNPTWTMHSYIEETIRGLRKKVGKKQVLCALSGGIDSSVVALLLHQAIGDQLTCIFVNNGALRKGEVQKVLATFGKHFNLNLQYVDAEERFLRKLKSVVDPEQKRKIIGHEFIHVFEEEARSLGHLDFLAQGTLYPDVIESCPVWGPSATIKSHHNVGGLPDGMKLELIEPLRELFKDEVRILGRELGLAEEIVWRQPFPGPGLAVRIIGEVTAERISMLQEADAIVEEEFAQSGWYRKVWQSFAVLLPIKTVGVMGDERTYEHVIALRVVESQDGMTADWVRLPYDLLAAISSRIINEVKGINRVTYDISSKPPSTIEWE